MAYEFQGKYYFGMTEITASEYFNIIQTLKNN